MLMKIVKGITTFKEREETVLAQKTFLANSSFPSSENMDQRVVEEYRSRYRKYVRAGPVALTVSATCVDLRTTGTGDGPCKGMEWDLVCVTLLSETRVGHIRRLWRGVWGMTACFGRFNGQHSNRSKGVTYLPFPHKQTRKYYEKTFGWLLERKIVDGHCRPFYISESQYIP